MLNLTTSDVTLDILRQNEEEYKAIFQDVSTILVPKKVETNLRRHVPKQLLKKIDKDIDIAVEKCLIIISNLDTTFYSEDKWKSLHSQILMKQVSNSNDSTYRACLDALMYPLQTGAMIECRTNNDGAETFEIGVKSKQYRVGYNYLKVGLTKYTLTNQELIQKRNKAYWALFTESIKNPICLNLVQLYSKIDIPTTEAILQEGKRLVKEGYTTKKGKKLTLRNKHNDSYWSDVANRSFVEDDIEIFNYLTNRGYMIPTAGDEKSGGRVVDSFTLMPSWIRAMVTINGNRLVECDYTALHPNLAIYAYQGNSEYLTHKTVAEMLGIDLRTAKVEHLSFFNKRWEGMEKSPLFDFYMENEPKMMDAIKVDKDKWYKITTMKLFKLEVEIMTEVVEILNSYGINAMYVYDALYVEPEHFETTKITMNDVIYSKGIRTRVGTL